MSEIIKQIQETILFDRTISFSSDASQFKIIINDHSGIEDISLLPLHDHHFSDERISECIKFQNDRINKLKKDKTKRIEKPSVVLDECIKTSEQMSEDLKFKLDSKRIKEPSKKRQIQRSFDFWSSLNQYLNKLKNIINE